MKTVNWRILWDVWQLLVFVSLVSNRYVRVAKSYNT